MAHWDTLPASERAGANDISCVDGPAMTAKAFWHTPSGFLARQDDGALVGHVPAGINVPWVRVIGTTIYLPTGEIVGDTDADWQHVVPPPATGTLVSGSVTLPRIAVPA